MANMDRDEWDDDELVPLGELRPSREHFGPVPGAAKGRPSQASATPSSSPSRRKEEDAAGGKSRSRSTAVDRTNDRTNRKAAQQPVRANRKANPRSAGGSHPQFPEGREEAFLRHLAEGHNPAAIAAKPTSGWRGALLKATGGAVNLGLSPVEKRELQLRQQARLPLTLGTVAVFSRKGGVGKTTISAYLGLTLAVERGGRIVALDGDAEAGSLGWLLVPKSPSTLAALASAQPIPSDYAELRRYTSVTPEGLEVIVGDPAEMGPISTTGLEVVADQLAHHYDVSIFDTGAGVTRATGRVLVNAARVLLLVMGPSVDSVRAAERTLAWMDDRPGEATNPHAKVIAVINGIPNTAKSSHIDKIENHFSNRCSAVVRIPWDAHLAAGNTVVSLDRLGKQTRRAFLELAATTTSVLATPSGRATVGGGRRAS